MSHLEEISELPQLEAPGPHLQEDLQPKPSQSWADRIESLKLEPWLADSALELLNRKGPEELSIIFAQDDLCLTKTICKLVLAAGEVDEAAETLHCYARSHGEQWQHTQVGGMRQS